MLIALTSIGVGVGVGTGEASHGVGRIAYVAEGSRSEIGVGNEDVWTVGAGGTDRRDLIDTAALEQNASWSPDGSRVAFVRTWSVRRANGVAFRSGIFTMDADGSGLHELVSCPSGTCLTDDLTWSPDGARLAFVDHRRRGDLPFEAVEVIDADGSGRRVLCSFKRCRQGLGSITWSPDGTRVAFSNGSQVYIGPIGPTPSWIWVASADGSDVHAITNTACSLRTASGCTSDTSPSWSPNGTIAFVRQFVTRPFGTSQSPALDVVYADGSGLRTLDRCRSEYCSFSTPAWSPDGSRIAYTDDSSKSEFRLVSSDGTQLRGVRTCGGGRCVVPTHLTWAPDGEHIAFLGGDAAVFTKDVGGGPIRELARNVDGCCLSWLASSSPAGRHKTPPHVSFSTHSDVPGQMVFTSQQAVAGNGFHQRSEIYVIDADGTHERVLDPSPTPNDEPAWSPDGRFIAFSSARSGFSRPQLWVMRADGSDLRVLTNIGHEGARQPTWLSGGWIAFVHEVSTRPYLVEVSERGGPIRRLARFPLQGAVSWTISPNGHDVTFAEYNGRSSSLLDLDLDTGATRRMVSLPGSIDAPAWSPDGSRLSFEWYSPANGRAVYVVDRDGSHLRRLTPDALEATPSTWSPNGRWIAVAATTPGGHGALFVVRPDGTGLSLVTTKRGGLATPEWRP